MGKATFVIASEAKQSIILLGKDWIASSLSLLAMTIFMRYLSHGWDPSRGVWTMPLKLFELVGTDEQRPFSPFCWRTRMPLAPKGLSAESIPWCFTGW